MRIAVLGLGFMGSTHLQALLANPQATVAAVYSSDEKKLSGDLTAVQGNLGGPSARLDLSQAKKFRDWQELLADPEIDAVDLCLPTHLHEPVALAALRAGKHVIVEKPIGLHPDLIREMIALASKQKRVLMAAHVLRFFPQYEVLRDQVRESLNGVRSALFRRRCAAPFWSAWLTDAAKSGGGILDLLIHDVDICLHLFGMPEAVTAEGDTDLERGIDIVVAQLHYPDIPSVVVTGGWHHPKSYPFSMEYTVVGTDATIEYGSASRPPTRYGVDGSAVELPLAAHDGYQAELAYFIDCCREGRQPDRCLPTESLAAVELMHLITKSRANRGERISCRS